MPRPKNWLPADHPLVRMIPVATDTLAANGKALVTGEARHLSASSARSLRRPDDARPSRARFQRAATYTPVSRSRTVTTRRFWARQERSLQSCTRRSLRFPNVFVRMRAEATPRETR
jgi:hypothetical protein